MFFSILHDEERHHPKTENLLYQNQSHRAYHKLKTNPFATERCQSKRGVGFGI